MPEAGTAGAAPPGPAARPAPGTALVTGGTDGLGREAARIIARAGYRVAIVGRDPEKGAAAARDLRASAGHDRVEFLGADLSRLAEVARLADEVQRRFGALQLLVHSAGAVRFRRVLTREGLEESFALNYLARFALTRRLLAALERGARPGRAARVVLAGGAARHGRIHYEDVSLASGFHVVRSVLQFQRASDGFTLELARRLAGPRGAPRVTITCLKLGVVRTNIRRDFPLWARALVRGLLDPLIGQSAIEAGTVLANLALDPALEGTTGALFEKVTRLRRVAPDRRVDDPAEGLRLWNLSEALERSALAAASGPERRAARDGDGPAAHAG